MKDKEQSYLDEWEYWHDARELESKSWKPPRKKPGWWPAFSTAYKIFFGFVFGSLVGYIAWLLPVSNSTKFIIAFILGIGLGVIVKNNIKWL